MKKMKLKISIPILCLKKYSENKDKIDAKKISKLFNTNHFEIPIDASEWLNYKETTMDAFGQPFSHAYSTFFVSSIMKEHLKVAYSGDGADELFGNYLSHRISACFDANHQNKFFEIDFDKKEFIKNFKNKKNWRFFLYTFTSSNFFPDFGLESYFKDLINEFENDFGSCVSNTILEKTLEYELLNHY